MTRIVLSSLFVLLAILGAANAEDRNPQDNINETLRNSLGSINQCYHGAHQSNPCDRNSYTIAVKIIIGEWKAVDKPWSIKFTPNGVSDFRNGTIVMSTIGSPKSGKYRIEPSADKDGYPTIFVNLNGGENFKASIAMYGSELLLIDDEKTTTFHRS